MPAKTAPPVPRPDFGDGESLDLGRSTLPFSAKDRQGEVEGIVVQIRCLTDDDDEARRVVGVLQEALRNVTYRGKKVVAVCTEGDVEMNMADQAKLAAFIIPSVMKSLGMRTPRDGAVLI